MNIRDFLATIILVPVGLLAVSSFICLLCLPFEWVEDYVVKRKVKHL